MQIFRELSFDQLRNVTDTIDEATLATSRQIVADVERRGAEALREYGEKYDGLEPGQSLFITGPDLKNAEQRIGREVRDLLSRVCSRIETFAVAQRESVSDVQLPIRGGEAGHRWIPLQSAGCYAPGGRYPLPSSILMTAATARVAGVKDIWVASPNSSDVMVAAASVAGASGFLRLGGAQAIAAMSFGMEPLPACDVIVGPGNRFVTAAKAIVSQTTRIDSLAGPSELVVVADSDADPRLIAADLLAQAEHDADARPILIVLERSFVKLVHQELEKQLADLETAETARLALQSGGWISVESLDEAIQCCNEIAPEHLSLQGQKLDRAAERFTSGAALFVGKLTAEVFGDYGEGPNHVLPTGGAAKSNSALSVLDFMRFQTVLKIQDLESGSDVVADAAAMGQLEGLVGHARSASIRTDSM